MQPAKQSNPARDWILEQTLNNDITQKCLPLGHIQLATPGVKKKNPVVLNLLFVFPPVHIIDLIARFKASQLRNKHRPIC